MDVSIRSYLATGVAAATAVVIVASPVSPPSPMTSATPAFTLSAAVQPLVTPVQTAAALIGTVTDAQPENQPKAAAKAAAVTLPTAPDWGLPSIGGQSIGNAIINIYNAVEPWVQWGFEVVAWAGSYVVGALAQQVNILYSSVEPIVGAIVYSCAYILDGEFSLVGPTLVSGVQTAAYNLIQGEIAWVLSFFPPLPPFGSALAAAASPAAAATAAGPAASTAASAAETAEPSGLRSTGHSAIGARAPHRSRDATPSATPDTSSSTDVATSTNGTTDTQSDTQADTGADGQAGAVKANSQRSPRPHRTIGGPSRATGKSAQADRRVASGRHH